ncbi:MAG: aspartate-alanine antiporter [Paramuribaculum sp.]|nr:aspartate-alanine antiporter [Paramuribaculum sp.]MDE6323616.1 aspartate-alanine antiporter [Paramuribaculum sp.]MDE6489359.1 aspartate-alanine antiporter [Paramuribaculum sp.]
MSWLIETFRTYPSIPIFLTIGLGFWLGKFKYKTFTLGTVTSVLLVGVLVGQLNIPIGAPLKSLFFLIFLFAIGYKCGPQFVAAIRGQGLKQVIFAVVVCFLCLGVTWLCAKLMNYDAAVATGLFSGAQTISAVIGVGADTIGSLHIPEEQKKQMIDLIPVCYAVTYVFGTIGSAWILGNLGPALLGGLKKVRQQTKELEQQLDHSDLSSDPAYIDGNRPIVFRAYEVESDHFATPLTVSQIEAHFQSLGRRLFVERVRTSSDGQIHDVTPETVVGKGDEIVLSGRHEFIIQDEGWIGKEVDDPTLLTFNVERTEVMVTKKVSGLTVDQLRAKPFMYGVMIRSISRQGGMAVPVLAQTKLMQGDMITLMGLPQEVSGAIKEIGYEQRPTNQTDMVFVSLAIVIGAIVGALTLNVHKIPISLSTSGGALIAGLFFGWLRTKRPSAGIIPEASLWLMNNLGLNMFIAVIGIQCGPTFIAGIEQVGWMLLIMGLISTSVPLFIAMFLGAKVFKFHPAINLGCCAGSRTTTAALGAITASLDSSVPALGYTITYAIGNTLLILMGVAMVLLFV